MKSFTRASGLLMAVLGAVVALASLFVLPYCHTPEPMTCYYMVHVAAALAAAVCALGLIMCVSSLTVARRLQLVNCLLGCAILAEAGWVIGPCPNPMMPCHSFTQPVLVLAGAAIALIGILDWWRLARKSQEGAA